MEEKKEIYNFPKDYIETTIDMAIRFGFWFYLEGFDNGERVNAPWLRYNRFEKQFYNKNACIGNSIGLSNSYSVYVLKEDFPLGEIL